MCATHTPTFPDNNGLSNNLHNNIFLPCFSSSPAWLLVTRTRGAWCRSRGYWRSRPRHLSPRSRICAQQWHCKDIHSHIHSHTPVHTPQKEKEEQNAQLTKHDAFVYWSSSCPVWWWAKARKLGTCSSGLPHVGGLLVLGQYWQKTFVDVFNKYSNIARQKMPFLITSTITLSGLASIVQNLQ